MITKLSPDNEKSTGVGGWKKKQTGMNKLYNKYKILSANTVEWILPIQNLLDILPITYSIIELYAPTLCENHLILSTIPPPRTTLHST